MCVELVAGYATRVLLALHDEHVAELNDSLRLQFVLIGVVIVIAILVEVVVQVVRKRLLAAGWLWLVVV